MRVLVACEFSGTVRDRFRAAGHEALSCDLLPSDTPGLHYQGDVRKLLDGWQPVHFAADCDPEGDGWCSVSNEDPGTCACIGPTQDGIEYREVDGELFGRPIDHPHWDMMLAFPPCTYLTSSGLHWNGRIPGRAEKTEEALEFVRCLMSAPIEFIAIENPQGCIGTRIRPASQYIQPYEFGADASKKTGLWLKNLPLLMPTRRVPGRKVFHNGKEVERWSNQTDSGQNRLGPSEDRWALRSITYPGIADAFVDQWG